MFRMSMRVVSLSLAISHDDRVAEKTTIQGHIDACRKLLAQAKAKLEA